MKIDWNRKVTKRELSQICLMLSAFFFILLVIQLHFYPNNAPLSITIPYIVIGAGIILGFVGWKSIVKDSK